jgi:hypothetical protein
VRRAGFLALLAVLGPGLLAGLSDDDPAGITTYSILGADFGYRLLWVLALSTAALIVFHELAARTGIVTGRGLMRLARERYGTRATTFALSALVVANIGTICAEFAGVAAGMDVLTGTSRYLTVPFAALAVSVLILRGSFARVEHVLLALSAIFVAYIFSGMLAGPDWGATARGLVVPSLPSTRHGILVVVATLGTTLAPWGLAFIQSYAVDKRRKVKDLNYERVDVVSGALLTGVIGGVHRRGLRCNAARERKTHTRSERRCNRAAATRWELRADPIRTWPRRGRAARGRDRAALHRLFGRGVVWATLRSQRQLPPVAALLRGLRRQHPSRRLDRAHPGRATDPDPVPLPSAQRGAAARDSAPSCGHSPAMAS